VPDRAAPASALKGNAFRALRSRNFVILWFGNLLSNTGTWMQQVAEPWLVLRLSNSPVLLGLDSFMIDAPIWLLILAGGIIADRRDRRRTALFFQGIQVVCPILIVAHRPHHELLRHATGDVHPGPRARRVSPREHRVWRRALSNLAAVAVSDLVLLFVIGGAMVASNTAANSILQTSIDRRVRGRVSSMYTLALRGGAPLGSLATGIVTSHWGVRPAFFVNGALALACHAALTRRARRRAQRKAVSSTPTGPPDAPRW
jgi:MFS family permease